MRHFSRSPSKIGHFKPCEIAVNDLLHDPAALGKDLLPGPPANFYPGPDPDLLDVIFLFDVGLKDALDSRREGRNGPYAEG